MLNIPPHLEACRPRGLFSIFHGTSSPVARRCPRASDLVLSAEHAFLLYERPGLHLQSGASAVGGVLRGARRAGHDRKMDVAISIHAPRVGRDSRPLMSLTMTLSFQSTRPVWGATRFVLQLCQAVRQFQSTRPVWGATSGSEMLSAMLIFQSTRPVWGATTPCRTHGAAAGNFNPRAPCGARRRHVQSEPGNTCISIHAPRVGRDLRVICCPKRLCISIHAPGGGATGSAGST